MAGQLFILEVLKDLDPATLLWRSSFGHSKGWAYF